MQRHVRFQTLPLLFLPKPRGPLPSRPSAKSHFYMRTPSPSFWAPVCFHCPVCIPHVVETVRRRQSWANDLTPLTQLPLILTYDMQM